MNSRPKSEAFLASQPSSPSCTMTACCAVCRASSNFFPAALQAGEDTAVPLPLPTTSTGRVVDAVRQLTLRSLSLPRQRFS
jgi:hypothetical protein